MRYSHNQNGPKIESETVNPHSAKPILVTWQNCRNDISVQDNGALCLRSQFFWDNNLRCHQKCPPDIRILGQKVRESWTTLSSRFNIAINTECHPAPPCLLATYPKLSLMISAKQQYVIWSNVTHVKTSAPHNKCIAFKLGMSDNIGRAILSARY